MSNDPGLGEGRGGMRTPSVYLGRRGTTKAALCSHSKLPAPEHSYLALLFIVFGEAALKPQREFLELHNDVGIGSIVFEAHGVLHDVLHQEKCLLKVAHRIFLENENLEFMVWLVWSGNPPGSVAGVLIPG